MQAVKDLAPYSPRLTAVDPYANAGGVDSLKPARPFWYSVDTQGLTILQLDSNKVMYRVTWPASFDVVQPDGEFVTIGAPSAGWEPVGMTVSYPTEEALASSSETPPTYVYVVMAHSGYEWGSNPNPPDLRSRNLRDTLAPATSPETESAILLQVDVTDPTFSPESYPAGPVVAGAILGHGAGQPAYDPATGNIYVGNMASTSLPTTPTAPKDLTSFVSVIAGIAPPEAGEVAVGPPEGGLGASLILRCGPEHPEIGILAGVPVAWPCLVEGGDGPFLWEYSGLPEWLTAHPDKLTKVLDGILYGTPPANGTYTFAVRATDMADPELPAISDWTSITVTVSLAGESEPGEGGFEVGVAAAQALEGTGSCEPASTSSPGSIVPAWIDVQPALLNGVLKGCFVMGTAPISGEYYEFAMPNFHFAEPFYFNPVIVSGNVAGPYVFDPLPAGVSLSGLAWHEIDKIHDPSTEADILNAEFFGVEPFTGQLYRILPPQGQVGEAAAAPETSIETDEVSAVGEPLITTLTSRPDIAAVLAEHTNLKVRFGDLVVEANRDPNIYVNAVQLLDPTGVDPTVIPIGGPTDADPLTIDIGAVIKVSATRDGTDPTVITFSAPGTIDLPGLQAYSTGLDSDLAPAVRGSEPGQVDHGVLWVTGTNTGNVAVIDTAVGQVAESLAVTGASSLGGVSIDFATRSAYVAGVSLMNVTIFGDGTASAPRAPVIWSAALATFNINEASSFEVMSTGKPVPKLSVQGELPTGVTFTDKGDGTATLAGTPLAAAAGDYSLTFMASNAQGAASQSFILTVATPPVITTPPATTFYVGAAGSFLVIATGSPVPIVWIEEPLPAWLTFTDNEDGTATLAGTPPEGSEGTFTFTIKANTGMPPDYVQAFTLTVNPGVPTPPAITSPAAATFVIDSEAVMFTVTATGYPKPVLSTPGPLPGGVTFTDNGNSTATLTGTPTVPGSYPFPITAANGVSPNAIQYFTLTVAPAPQTPPAITFHPTSQTVVVGQSAAFTVVATGTEPLSYQWRRNGANITGANSPSYDTGATTMADNGALFSVVVLNPFGSVTSNSATLRVTGAPVAPSITAQPANRTVTAGQTATFSVGVNGTEPLSYRWRKNGSDIPGAVSASYTTPATTTADNGSTFAVVVQNSIGSVTSNNATLTVNPAPVAPSISSASTTTFTVGSAGSFTVTASGQPTPTLSSWGTLPLGVTFTPNGNGTATLAGTPAAGTQNSYQVTITAANGVAPNATQYFTLIVNPAPVTPPAITTQPANQAVTAGQTATFAVVATGTAPLSYQWWKNGTSIGGATFASYTTPATTTADNGSTFSVVVTNSAASVTSNGAILTVTAAATAPAITAQPANRTVTAGLTATFTSTASGTPTPTVQWQLSTNNGRRWANIGATSTSYTTGPTTTTMNGYQYRAVFTNSSGSATSNAATLTVNPQPQPLAVTTASLPAGTVGQAYSQQLAAQGGTTPYTWSGSGLPVGLTLSSTTGIISGTPSAQGNNSVTVTVTDSATHSANRTLSLRIRR